VSIKGVKGWSPTEGFRVTMGKEAGGEGLGTNEGTQKTWSKGKKDIFRSGVQKGDRKTELPITFNGRRGGKNRKDGEYNGIMAVPLREGGTRELASDERKPDEKRGCYEFGLMGLGRNK